jgi:hypothetical protein
MQEMSLRKVFCLNSNVRPLQMATPCIHESLFVSPKTVKMEENPHLLLCTTSFMFIPTGPLRKLTIGSLGPRSKRGAYSSLSKKQCNIVIPSHALSKRKWEESIGKGLQSNRAANEVLRSKPCFRKNMWTWNLQSKVPETFWRYCKPWPTSSERLEKSVGNIVDGDIFRSKSCNMEMGCNCVDGEPCSADAAKVQSHGPGPPFAACYNIQHECSQ